MKTREWSDLGEFQSIAETASRIFVLEGDPSNTVYHPDGGIRFRVRLDPSNPGTDADLFSSLELACTRYFYLIVRAVQ